MQTVRSETTIPERGSAIFAEEVKPLLARACGGQVENKPLGLNFDDRR
jgi:hypothetical protein